MMRRPPRSLSIVLLLSCLSSFGPALGASTDEGAGGPLSLEEADPGAFEAPTPEYLEHYARPFRIDRSEISFTQSYYWNRLFHPTSRDKAWGTGVLLAALSLWSQKFDFQADMAQRGTPAEHARSLNRIGKLGGGAIVPGMALLFYLGGSTFREYRAKETGFMLAESLFLTDLLTVTGRWILAEDRPKYGGDLHPFRGFGGGISGHSATAASISGVLSRMYLRPSPGDGHAARAFKRIGKGLAYGLPVLVAYSRINDEQHFAYNTVLGLSIGFWTSHAVADAHGLYLEGRASRWRPVAVGPIASDRGAPGIAFRWEF